MINISLFGSFFRSIREMVYQGDSVTLEELIGQLSAEEVEKNMLLNIPSVSGCVNLISGTIASLPVKLYKSEGGKVSPVETDQRVSLLNDNTGDTLDGFQFKQALVNDFLLYGGGYGYINRRRNNVTSLHYVENVKVGVSNGTDPIFKKSDLLVNGSTYQLYQFIRLLRKSKNGSQGVGILNENYEALKVIFNSMRYEGLLVASGGNKKGFIKSENRLSPEAVAELKRQWNDMYRNNNSNCVVLNNGLQFQESANTSVEMQLNENKKTNAVEVYRMFNMPENILNGKATDEEYQIFIKMTILPIISQFETALNNALLNNDERALFYFKFDTKELLKGDLLKRMTAYQIGIDCGVMQIDDARYNEDLGPLGLDFIKLGLQDVLYNPKTKEIYTPNTNQTKDTTATKGGEVDNEDRNKIGSSDN